MAGGERRPAPIGVSRFPRFVDPAVTKAEALPVLDGAFQAGVLAFEGTGKEERKRYLWWGGPINAPPLSAPHKVKAKNAYVDHAPPTLFHQAASQYHLPLRAYFGVMATGRYLHRREGYHQ